MENNKLTAVEWLVNEIDMQYPHIDIRWKEWMINQAKAMEEEQIINAYRVGKTEVNIPPEKLTTGQQYYNETYGKE